MNFKAVLIDGDGVVLKKREFFSSKLSREYNVPIDKIIPFFKNEFRLCQSGTLDLKIALAPYVLDWGWKGSVDDFLRYWFEGNTVLDDEVMARIQNFRENGIKCYLVTDQEKYRADYIRNNLKLKQKLDGCFFSCEIGSSKSKFEFFQKVLEKINLSGNDVIYIDDEKENLIVAEKSLINTRLYKGLGDLI